MKTTGLTLNPFRDGQNIYSGIERLLFTLAIHINHIKLYHKCNSIVVVLNKVHARVLLNDGPRFYYEAQGLINSVLYIVKPNELM